jgi:hypothetical protein
MLSANKMCSTDRLLVELRNAIFDSCEGECISGETIRSLYVEGLITTAGSSTLAHIVSCPVCLDAVNTRLGLPPLAERHPADTLGPNNDWRNGTRGPRDSGGSGSAVPLRQRGKTKDAKISGSLLSQCRRRATELFEHYPRELCVSVNGYVLGSQSVSSQVSRLRLDVTIAEELNFVEVLSEERARLLLMTIEPPPDGEPVQYRRLRLSENRYLEVTFHYGHPWPMVEVVYEEPNFIQEAQPALPPHKAQPAEVTPVQFGQTSFLGLESLGRSRSTGLFDLLGSFNLLKSLWLRPGFIAAVVSLVLIGILLTFRLERSQSVTAANLLERARVEESAQLPANVAMHRVIELEQRRRSDGATIGKNRIEVWRDAGRGISVRRVYDQREQLLGGVWINEKPDDGRPLRRIYRRGSAQRIETATQDPARAIRDSELWQLDPSAIVFTAFLSRPDAAHVKETAEGYVLNYTVDQRRDDGLLQATLTLRKSDLHPVAQTLAISDGRETYDYRFSETVFERTPLNLVSPAVFEPDAELISKTETRVSRATEKHTALSSVAGPAHANSAELEVDVAYALDRFRIRFGDQLSLLKTPAGLLEIKGVVDTDDTRKEILRELSLVINNPGAVRIHLDTTAELLARKSKFAGRVIVGDFAGGDQSIPLYSELSRYFSSHEGSGQTEQQRDRLVRDFAAQTISRSQRAVAHSLELKQLASRFSAAQLDQFTPSARAKWFSLVRNHAEALRRELATLDGELQLIVFPNDGGIAEAERVEIGNDATLLLEIDRLHKLVLAVDLAVRASFAASSGTATNDSVKSARFRSGLATSLRLADEIRNAVGGK